MEQRETELDRQTRPDQTRLDYTRQKRQTVSLVVCLANTCTCNDGTAAVANDGSCEVNGAEDCTACNTGYTLNGQVCEGSCVLVMLSLRPHVLLCV